MIVFLDIDGPIANQRSALAGFAYDPATVVIVNEFLSHPSVQVVLSSTVRILHTRPERMLQHLYQKYALRGFKFHEHWRTGKNLGAGPGNRQREIQEWLDNNSWHHKGPYVAIDDDPINIENVIQIKADYNGIPYVELLRMRSLHDSSKCKELHEWEEWEKSRVPNCDRC